MSSKSVTALSVSEPVITVTVALPLLPFSIIVLVDGGSSQSIVTLCIFLSGSLNVVVLTPACELSTVVVLSKLSVLVVMLPLLISPFESVVVIAESPISRCCTVASVVRLLELCQCCVWSGMSGDVHVCTRSCRLDC